MQFNCRVDAVHYDEASNVWRLRLSDGRALNARFVIMATGLLSIPTMPRLESMDRAETADKGGHLTVFRRRANWAARSITARSLRPRWPRSDGVTTRSSPPAPAQRGMHKIYGCVLLACAISFACADVGRSGTVAHFRLGLKR